MVTGLKHYVGTKRIQATPMNLGAYNIHRGWSIQLDEDPTREGYLVVYPDTYQSWSPKEIFEESYREISALNFGIALEMLKSGSKITRQAWGEKGVFVVYQKGYPAGIPCNKQTAQAWGLNEGDLFKCEPYLQIQLPNGSHAMWSPSISDVLAEDWLIIE